MNRTTIAIEQIEEDNGNRHISISGRRNGRIYFTETFDIDASNDPPLEVHLFRKTEVENYDASKSASVVSLLKLLNTITCGEKTNGRLIDIEEVNMKFPITDLITIRNFERAANVQFDYSKFNTLAQFQNYFSNLLNK